MTRTTGATDAPPTGPTWEPKIIGARELWAIRESFKFCDTTQISDAVLDTMVNIMDGTPTRTNGFQSHGIRIKDCGLSASMICGRWLNSLSPATTSSV